MSPERRRFVTVLRARQLGLQKERLRRALERMPSAALRQLVTAVVESPAFWPLPRPHHAVLTDSNGRVIDPTGRQPS